MTERSVDLLSMKIFISVYEGRSVNAAAREHGMSQSGLSTALARMRVNLSDALFVSTSAGMQPTARAHELIGPMREAVQCIEQRILKEQRFDPATSEREFKIAQSDVVEATHMPRVVQALMRQAPRVRLRTLEPPLDQLRRVLSEGEVDLALGYLPDLVSREFVRRKFFQDSFVCICGSHNRRVAESLDLRTYCEARHVIAEAPGRRQSILERHLQRKGIRRNVVLTTPHLASLPEIVSQTELIATIPRASAMRFARTGRLILLELPFRSPVFDAHLHWSKSVHADPAHRWLRGVVHDALVGAPPV